LNLAGNCYRVNKILKKFVKCCKQKGKNSAIANELQVGNGIFRPNWQAPEVLRFLFAFYGLETGKPFIFNSLRLANKTANKILENKRRKPQSLVT